MDEDFLEQQDDDLTTLCMLQLEGPLQPNHAGTQVLIET